MRMNRRIVGLLLVLLLIFAGFPAWAQSYSLLVEPGELTDALARQEGIFVDLRSEKAYNRMHIPGFIHLPYDEEDVLALAAKQEPIYLICTAGRASAKAYNLLLQAGAREVHAAVFGVEEYAEAAGLENMEGADICVPCILLQKSLEEGSGDTIEESNTDTDEREAE